MTNIFPLLGAVTPIRMASVNAAKLFPDNSIDIVFIDACHEYECVKEDINAWLPKIKKGGIISGHDYQWGDDKRPEGAPVKKAVDEIFGVTNVTFIHGNWENVWMVNLL
jgi:predicted O-methyltransferase YrrM